MEITTKDIIAYLPLDPEFKKALELNLDQIDLDRKFEIINNLWMAFDDFFEIRFQENLQKSIGDVTSKDPMGPDFYKKVRDETRKEIEREMTNKTTNYNITAVREKLQRL